MTSKKENKIICFIPGEQDAFSVKIEKSGLVDDLKDKIKKKRSRTFANVEAATLNLYRVIIDESLDNKKKFIDQLNQYSQNLDESVVALWGGRQLSSYFSESPAPPGKYYIIVQIPKGEPTGESIKTTVCGALAETVLTHPIYPR